MALNQTTKENRILSFANQHPILTRNRRHVCKEEMTNQRITYEAVTANTNAMP